MNQDQEDKYLRDVHRGQKAAKILNDEMVVGALSQMRTVIYEKWKDCAIKDHDIQHELKLQLTALENFERYFREAVTNGEFSAKQLEIDRSMKARVKRMRQGFMA